MTYELYIGDRAYSSWSLRAWLLFDHFHLPYSSHLLDLAQDASVRDQLGIGLAKTVPTVVTPDGVVLSESISIAEELASRHPDAGLWPNDANARAVARNLTAEMHSGFGTLRQLCPMNLRVAYSGMDIPKALQDDLNRLDEIWSAARDDYASQGPWLVGAYSIADAFYAPVAARLAGYGHTLSDTAMAYVQAHLNHGSFRRWRAMGLVRGENLARYDQPWPQVPWPAPPKRAAIAVDKGPSRNEHCPYSGAPVTHFLEMDGEVFGMCNAFCRDKTVADPEAWPQFMALLS